MSSNDTDQKIDLNGRVALVTRGARHDGDRFETLSVPDDLWGEVDRSDFVSALIPGLFVEGSIGDRLFIDAIIMTNVLPDRCICNHRFRMGCDRPVWRADAGHFAA